MTCVGCRNGLALPFDFKMAFQPIVDVGRHQVWGYEALVRGPNGESAYSVLSQVSDELKYQFDQAARVLAIETAGKLFGDRDLKLSINFMPNAVYEPKACIQKSLAAAKRSVSSSEPHVRVTENEKMTDAAHVQRLWRRIAPWVSGPRSMTSAQATLGSAF